MVNIRYMGITWYSVISMYAVVSRYVVLTWLFIYTKYVIIWVCELRKMFN